jgi:hypothetical protein
MGRLCRPLLRIVGEANLNVTFSSPIAIGGYR